jgi:hypothetical protein
MFNFVHDRHPFNSKGGKTLAIEQIPVEMMNQITLEHVLVLKMGEAICHEDDNYNKKIGRELALSRIEEVEFDIVGVHKVIKDDGRKKTTIRIKHPFKKMEFMLIHTEGNKSVHIR